MDYATFVKLHGGKSTAALAAAWKARFGGGAAPAAGGLAGAGAFKAIDAGVPPPPLPPPAAAAAASNAVGGAPAPERPAWTPGAMDEQGLADLAAINQQYDDLIRGIDTDTTKNQTDYDYRQKMLDREKMLRFKDAMQAFSGRGMAISGLHDEAESNVRAEDLNQREQALNQFNEVNRTLGDRRKAAEGFKTTGGSSTSAAANARSLAAYNSAAGGQASTGAGGAAVTPPAATKPAAKPPTLPKKAVNSAAVGYLSPSRIRTQKKTTSGVRMGF